MEATNFSETLIISTKFSQRCNPEEHNLNTQPREPRISKLGYGVFVSLKVGRWKKSGKAHTEMSER
jgi:hypothetical protein